MENNNNLPSTINGDGRKFISLLKGYLNDIKIELENQINEATKVWNGIADNPDTIPEQVRNITIDELKLCSIKFTKLKVSLNNQERH